MHGQVSKQLCGTALAANQLDRLVQAKGWLEETVDDQLRQDVGRADQDSRGATGRLPTQSLLKFFAEREDVVCVSQGDLTGVGQDHAASNALEQRFPERGLQVADLRADGLGGEMQLPARAREIALPCDRLEQS
jgi:hypothetical protein